MGSNRYLPNSYLEPIKDRERLLEFLEDHMYSFADELNLNIELHSHSSVYCGISGILYMNLILYEHDRRDEHLRKAKEIVKLLRRSKFKHMTSFLEGRCGFHSLKSMVHFYLNSGELFGITEDNACRKEVAALTEYFIHNRSDLLHVDNGQNELLYGKCGLIYSFLFCQQGWTRYEDDRPKIVAILYLLLNSIVINGKKYASLNKSSIPLSLYFEWHGNVYLGAAHGYAGILFVLWKTIHFLFKHLHDVVKGLYTAGLNYNDDPDVDILKKELLDYIHLIYKVTSEILDLYVTSEFNVYSSVKREKIENKKVEKLVQWCHGCPGFIILIIELLKKNTIKTLETIIDADPYKLLVDTQNAFHNKYVSLIEKMGMLVWEKGLLTKGCGLCHGIAGNGIVFVYIYNFTNDEKWYNRALQYGHFCIKNFKQIYDVPDLPDSLFEGYAGLVVFLSFLLKPNMAHFPAHDFSKIINDIIY